MRRRLIIGLIVLNGLVAGALVATPATSQIIPRGLFNCCKTDDGFEPYCCSMCCWFYKNCRANIDCEASPQT